MFGMQEAMEQAAGEAWRKRAAGLRSHRREAMVLASEIEKRRRFRRAAEGDAVLMNRMRRRMKTRERPDGDLRPTGGKGG